MTIFLVVLMIGFNFFLRSQRLTQLAESEAKMQMYARQAMTIITKELRQASDYKEKFDIGDPTSEAKDVRFVRPAQGLIGQYTLVRYWYAKNDKGIFSLYRAEMSNGTNPNVTTDFTPNPISASDRTTYKIRSLIKEATVIDPGERSFFHQDPDNRSSLSIRLVTATYGIEDGSLTGEYEVKRQFNLDNEIYARNLNK